MAEKNQSSPGAEARRERGQRALDWLDMLGYWSNKLRREGVDVREIRIKLPTEPGAETRCMIKGRIEGHPVIAFHSASTGSEALSGALERLGNGSLKFVEDKFAASNEGKP